MRGEAASGGQSDTAFTSMPVDRPSVAAEFSKACAAWTCGRARATLRSSILRTNDTYANLVAVVCGPSFGTRVLAVQECFSQEDRLCIDGQLVDTDGLVSSRRPRGRALRVTSEDLESAKATGRSEYDRASTRVLRFRASRSSTGASRPDAAARRPSGTPPTIAATAQSAHVRD